MAFLSPGHGFLNNQTLPLRKTKLLNQVLFTQVRKATGEKDGLKQVSYSHFSFAKGVTWLHLYLIDSVSDLSSLFPNSLCTLSFKELIEK